MRAWTVIILTSASALTVLACGGGGGGGGGAPAEVTAATAAELTSGAVGGTNALFFGTTFGSGQAGDSTSLVAAAMQRNPQRLSAITLANVAAVPGGQDSGRASVRGDCEDGGSASAQATWDGLGPPVSCEEALDLRVTIVFDHCQENGVTADGVLRLELTGDACCPSVFDLDYSGLTIQAPDQDAELDMRLLTTDIQCDDSGNLTAFHQVIDGSLTGTVEGVVLDVAYRDFELDVSDLISDVDGSFLSATLAISGDVKSSCIDGFVTIETLEPLAISSDQCPVGSLRLVGDGEATVTFNEDESVRIDIEHETGTAVLQFDHCSNVPSCGP